jgi:predicted small secreted protein
MKKIRALVVIATLLLAVSACNTINGFGKDVQKAGEKVEEASKK